MNGSKLNLPDYVFRGTSYRYQGSPSSVAIPCTCTTKNPLKAALFAMVCKTSFDIQPVVYIAKTEKLKETELLVPNVLSHIEEDINWKIKPLDFYRRCEGYITLEEMKAALTRVSKTITGSVYLHNLSLRCKEAGEMDVAEIEKLMRLIQPKIKIL